LIPTPIRKALFTIQTHGVRALVMGGQACVLYGAAQVSKDLDFLLLHDPDNLAALRAALAAMRAERIAVPPFNETVLRDGLAVHFRCHAPDVSGLRIDVMTHLRQPCDFNALWDRRVVLEDSDGLRLNVMSVPDLVSAKKTQRSKDWPMIEALVAVHYHEHGHEPTDERIAFWLGEARSPRMLIDLAERFPEHAERERTRRPLLAHAIARQPDALAEALDAEVRAERERDRQYWAPLRKRIEAFRRNRHRND